MNLLLQNGYPYPYPEGFDPEHENYDCRNFAVELEGVAHFEWKYELTIEFRDQEAYDVARELTGWSVWDASEFILSATTSAEDGYQHPAIIVCDKAYCGFILVADT